MMDVVIVHDRSDVAREIERIVRASNCAVRVEIAADLREARRYLTANAFDLMVLDLTLPNQLGSDAPSFQNVHNLLKEIYEFGDLLAPADLIGISREADALDLMRSGLGDHFMVALVEDDGDGWKRQLSERVRYAFRSSDSKMTSLARHHSVDALIVTAMDEEFAPYRTLFDLQDDPRFAGVSRFSFMDRSGQVRSGIGFSIGSSGQASAASRTQSLISWFRPRVALMTGYCGGVKKKIELGDLCFFESAAPWDYGKWAETRDEHGVLLSEEFRSRPNALPIDEGELKLAARKLCMENGNIDPAEFGVLSSLAPKGKIIPNFLLTHAASGSAVVANDTVVAQIKGLNDAIRAVDMESYGFYDACGKTFVAKPKYLCIKSVSDFCNGEKGDDYHGFCSYLSAITARRILSSLVSFG